MSFCRVWERGKERDHLESGPSKSYRSTFADALKRIVLGVEDRGWDKPK